MSMSPRLLRPVAPGAVTDPYFSYVTLLLHMNGADNSTTFTDSSSYARAITPSANAFISTAQSKFNGSSGYFDGSAELTTPTVSELSFGTGDFTVECWVYKQFSYSAQFIATAGGSSGGGWFFGHNEAGYGLGFGRAAVAWDLLDVTGTLPTGQWTHCAVTRSGTTLRSFVDGVVKETATNSSSFDCVNTSLFIGSHGGMLYFNGYMAELRITNGVARYTNAFTPPTDPFPDQ